MIGPGWMPGLPRERGIRKRTLAYTRTRRRSQPRTNRAAATPLLPQTDLVLFDPAGRSESGLLHFGQPAELPVATALPDEPRARAIALVAGLQRWFAARWQWLRPRTVPCAVAALGMLAVIESADYLAHKLDADTGGARVVHIEIAPR